MPDITDLQHPGVLPASRRGHTGVYNDAIREREAATREGER